jgi:hypothetical protein
MGGEENCAAIILPSQLGVPSFQGFHRHSIATGDPLGDLKGRTNGSFPSSMFKRVPVALSVIAMGTLSAVIPWMVDWTPTMWLEALRMVTC